MTELSRASAKISRRALLGGAATLSSAAVVSAAASSLAPITPSAGKYHPVIASASRNIIETDSGKIYGYSRGGVVGYRGISYGATTEGAGRFMPPRKVTPWAGLRSTLYWGAASPSNINCSVRGRRPGWAHDDQAFMFEWDDGQPSEDCLRLNVWTPGLDNKKRAVMFFIHGGGGMAYGSSNEVRAYDGENLARSQDVVVVTINHRLGVLGFLNLMEYGEQYASSPNVSMLDILQGLKWVGSNISNFGGDPGRVMIFGQAGGSAKVGIIMAMPSAKGLFHRASIQSGSELPQSAAEPSARLARATLSELGISKDNIGKLHTDFTFRQIVQAGMTAQTKVSRGAAWWPVEDGRLIPSITWDSGAPEASANVPLIIGSVLNESYNTLQMGDASLEGIDIADAKRRLDSLMSGHANHVAEVTRKLYPTATPFEVFSRAAAMRHRMSAYKQAEQKAKRRAASAYLYRFEWQSPMCDGRARAFHYGELPFCFQNASLCAKLTGNTPDSRQLESRVAGAWAAFAKTGNPNHPGIPKWEAYNDSIPTMRFDTKCVATNDPDAELRKAVRETMA